MNENEGLTRRDFLKYSIAGGTATLAGMFKLDFVAAASASGETQFWDMSDKLNKIQTGQSTATICPYCACGCGMIVTTFGGEIIDCDGDPEHPINEGKLCSKGNAYMQLITNEYRITKPMKRTNPNKGVDQDPGWQEITWAEAFDTIATKVKTAMDNITVKHTGTNGDDYYSQGIDHTIAMHGSSYFNNEDCYLAKKIISILGSSENEHQARKCHASTVAGLGSTFGFGAMTNHFIDMKNTKRILLLGSNAVENHPISFKWVRKAIDENDAKLIVLDPRYSRTASQAHLYAKFRSGSDTAIFLGIIRYLMYEKPDRINTTFLEDRTNAPYNYNNIVANSNTVAKVGLNNSNSVYQKLKTVVNTYTPEEVERITFIPKDTFLEICDLYTEEQPGTIMYSMGTTQHTNATHYIRAYAILQLMLGNMGAPGGGVNALRGISNVQGSTDMNLLSHYVMGYRGFPRNMDDVRRFQKWKNADPAVRGGVTGGVAADWNDASYNAKTQRFGWRHFKTWNALEYNWGLFVGTYPGLDPDNEPAICDLPVGKGNPTIQLFRKMLKAGSANGGYDVVFIFGENNAVSNANSTKIRDALAAANTFVVVYEIFDHETAHFADLLLPATLPVERYGTVTNSGRWVQWRPKCCDSSVSLGKPDAMNKPELEFLTELFAAIRDEGVMTPSEKFMADNSLTANQLNTKVDECWPSPYFNTRPGTAGYTENELRDVAIGVYREIGCSGTDAAAEALRGRSAAQKPANILHIGSYDDTTAALDVAHVLASRRDKSEANRSAQDIANGYFKNWAWSWMKNQRILYYLGEDPAGLNTFFNWWAWTDDFYPATGGLDIASVWSASRFNRTAAETEFGTANAAKHPLYHGVPVHNEPVESPLADLIADYPTIWDNDATRRKFEIEIGDRSQYPTVLTTFRLTEHMQAGAMTRNLPWLAELHPEPFLEMSEEFATANSISQGQYVNLSTARGSVRVKAQITDRIKPLVTSAGARVDLVAMPWHWGFKAMGQVNGFGSGATANDVTMDAVDYHANIPETKVCLCKVTPEVV